MCSGPTPAFLEKISRATLDAFRMAETRLPPDVIAALKKAAGQEQDARAKGELENILMNISLAEKLGVPLCQDTGVPVVYLTVPRMSRSRRRFTMQ
jgi:fumarate hydratase subunit alpha